MKLCDISKGDAKLAVSISLFLLENRQAIKPCQYTNLSKTHILSPHNDSVLILERPLLMGSRLVNYTVI
jgi:hypothetical protein